MYSIMIFYFTAAKVLLFRKYHITNDKYFIGVIDVLCFFVLSVIILPLNRKNSVMNKQNTNETRFITKKGNKITDLLT